MIWLPWLGLPHVIGADPRDGEGACCLVMTHILLTDAGLSPPPLEPMIAMAKAGEVSNLEAAYNQATEAIAGPENLAMTMFQTEIGVGVGIVVDSNFVLIPHHKSGVKAISLRALTRQPWRRLK